MGKFTKNYMAIFGWDYVDPNGGMFPKGKGVWIDDDKGEIVRIRCQDKDYLIPANYLQTPDEYKKANQ